MVETNQIRKMDMLSSFLKINSIATNKVGTLRHANKYKVRFEIVPSSTRFAQEAHIHNIETATQHILKSTFWLLKATCALYSYNITD
jgi:hypothetical protein